MNEINFVTTGKLIPADSGERLSTFNMLNALADDTRINLFCFMVEEGYSVEELKLFHPNINVVPIREHLEKTGIITLIQTFLFFIPYLYAVRRKRNQKRSYLSGALNSEHTTIWNHYRTTAYFTGSNGKNILIQHNNETKILLLRARRSNNVFVKIFCIFQAEIVKFNYNKMVEKFSTIIYESSFDYEKFDEKNILLKYLPIKYNSEKVPINELNTHKLLFIGSLDWYPNIDGIAWFIDNVFYSLPDHFTLTVVGRNPSKKFIQYIGRKSRIRLVANAKSIKEFYLSSDIFIAPILTGAGINIKLLEAISYGIPIVSTKFALRGYFNTDFFHATDHAKDFAENILKLSEDYKKRQHYQEKLISFYTDFVQKSNIELINLKKIF